MKCTILTVGTEILFGSITNTNAVYLSKELQSLGIDVMYHMTVGDNPGRLKDMLDYAFKDCDLVITTGGLGPTEDDLTKETVAEYFGEECVSREEEVQAVTGWFERAHLCKITENNMKQAKFPASAVTIKNDWGTAPGFYIEKDGKIVICFPGPPREMNPMFEAYVKPMLKEKQDATIFYKMIKTINIGESELETVLLPLIDAQTDPTLATYAAAHECSLRVCSKRASREEAEAAVEEMMVKVRALIGDNIYSEDGEEFVSVVSNLLRKKKLVLSCAESCTGGLFAKTITDIPGSSDIFDRGLVTYTPKAKNEELGVPMELIDKYGVVSAEVAASMAEGLHGVSGSDVCVSVTGVAGPSGGTEKTPVGCYFIGLYYKGETKSFRRMAHSPHRASVRTSAVMDMLKLIYAAIKD